MNFRIIFNIKDTSESPTLMVVNSLLVSFLIPDCPYISHTTSNLCFLNKLPEFITNKFLKIVKVVLIICLPISLKSLKASSNKVLAFQSLKQTFLLELPVFNLILIGRVFKRVVPSSCSIPSALCSFSILENIMEEDLMIINFLFLVLCQTIFYFLFDPGIASRQCGRSQPLYKRPSPGSSERLLFSPGTRT